MMQQEDQRHANEIDKMKQQHQLEILELQTQFSDGFSDDDQSHEFEELDHEIASLKDAIAKIENAPPPSGDTDDIDEEAEERLRILEERLDEITLTRDEALQQREEDSKASTQMIEQLIIKNQDDELAFKTEIDQLVDRLSQIDREHSERIDEITHEFQENKKNIASALKNSLSRIAQLQNNFTKKQRAHNKTMIAMHDELDRLKANLESYTTRQKQQMREATYAAKCIIEEKQKFRSFHRELEMLNSELVRESVEHETLMMELNKMDGLILSQMSAVGSRNSSVTYSRNSRF
ncbi:hypothetical protein TRFO_35633 [Tritrichomonas foetus]|uniref:Uncharacterized protein n=1 Tax=Tritrichomonas foetus TaxID=1144522 RepID=A0A1J4JFN1_9EUKA|nr:hypothetical protein TRFO_35633 [Tritrichomonas foetus]|eukprot:OHS98030.1 hypothetical protein TRFO_35633 [Tritrichomonas foetus]